MSVETVTYGHLIDGVWRIPGTTIPVLNKFTGKEFARIGAASRQDVTDAVSAAAAAYKSRPISPYDRYQILMRAAELFKDRKEDLSRILVTEAGKVWKDARAEIDRGIQTFIASAEEAKRIAGEGIPLAQPGHEHKLAFTVRVPVGVVAAISPFNYPFNLTAHKVAPAIAAGNAVVLKPAAATPVIACVMADILAEAGLPAGYVNVVNGAGRDTGEYLLEDDRISLYTFTGSPEVGQHVKSKTGIRKVTLELGNNSPNIVHADAPDVGKAAELCVRHGFSNAGQTCISVQRVYVHRSILEPFLQSAVEVARSLVVGDPADPLSDIGPMISEKEAERAHSWIQEAVSEGARIAVGGQRLGAVLQPTILVDVRPNMRVVCQEVFAPVISILPYDDIQEAFKQANDSHFGLQAGVFTSNLQLAMQAVRELEFGGVIINDVSNYRIDAMPYGGIKNSGIGKEGPRYTVQEMTDERLVVINL